MTSTPAAAALLQPVGFAPAKTRDQILQDWLDAKKALDIAKELEMAARTATVAVMGFDPTQREGTANVPLANDYKLKCVKKLNYNLKNGSGETDAALDKLEKMSEHGKFVADRLVKWKPELSISEWRELSPAEKALFDGALTITDGAPSLELIEPKAKK